METPAIRWISSITLQVIGSINEQEKVASDLLKSLAVNEGIIELALLP